MIKCRDFISKKCFSKVQPIKLDLFGFIEQYIKNVSILTGQVIGELTEAVNANHQIRTAELELIQTYFEPSEKGKILAEAFTATDILNRLKASGVAQSQLNVTSIGRALKLLGFKQVSERLGENKIPRKIFWLKFILPIEPTTLTTKI